MTGPAAFDAAAKDAGKNFPSRNNFDLIRLVAASQVAVVHATYNLGLHFPAHERVMQLLECFPGVPIFFAVSGFLISASYRRAPSLCQYAANRALRIFPALWACFILGLGLAFLSGYFVHNPVPMPTFVAWTAGQLSFVQFFNPQFMREYGEGVLNGSLWTIPVEMQFYLLTPIILITLRRGWMIFACLFAISIVANLIHGQGLDGQLAGSLAEKLHAVSFLPWIFMFLTGMLLEVMWPCIRRFVEGKGLCWLAGYACLTALQMAFGIGLHGNALPFPYAIFLSITTISLAFTRGQWAERLLHRNDISYGIYIYHMPIYNFCLELWGPLKGAPLMLAILSVPVVSLVSWRLIEAPSMRLKKVTLLVRRSSEQRA